MVQGCHDSLKWGSIAPTPSTTCVDLSLFNIGQPFRLKSIEIRLSFQTCPFLPSLQLVEVATCCFVATLTNFCILLWFRLTSYDFWKFGIGCIFSLKLYCLPHWESTLILPIIPPFSLFQVQFCDLFMIHPCSFIHSNLVFFIPFLCYIDYVQSILTDSLNFHKCNSYGSFHNLSIWLHHR